MRPPVFPLQQNVAGSNPVAGIAVQLLGALIQRQVASKSAEEADHATPAPAGVDLSAIASLLTVLHLASQSTPPSPAKIPAVVPSGIFTIIGGFFVALFGLIYLIVTQHIDGPALYVALPGFGALLIMFGNAVHTLQPAPC
jgi:capsular polysaccharide biosynthesis protein